MTGDRDIKMRSHDSILDSWRHDCHRVLMTSHVSKIRGEIKILHSTHYQHPTLGSRHFLRPASCYLRGRKSQLQARGVRPSGAARTGDWSPGRTLRGQEGSGWCPLSPDTDLEWNVTKDDRTENLKKKQLLSKCFATRNLSQLWKWKANFKHCSKEYKNIGSTGGVRANHARNSTHRREVYVILNQGHYVGSQMRFGSGIGQNKM